MNLIIALVHNTVKYQNADDFVAYHKIYQPSWLTAKGDSFLKA